MASALPVVATWEDCVKWYTSSLMSGWDATLLHEVAEAAWGTAYASAVAAEVTGFVFERSYTVETLCMNTTLGHCYNV